MCNIQYGLTEEKANPSAFRTLGEEKANLSAFRTFVRFVLVWICRFPLPLGVWEGLRFMIVALPGLFSYLFFFYHQDSLIISLMYNSLSVFVGLISKIHG